MNYSANATTISSPKHIETPNYFTSSYSSHFVNKSNEGKEVNTPMGAKLMKHLEKSKEYEYPPLPNIQAARMAYL